MNSITKIIINKEELNETFGKFEESLEIRK
jgi:hypothetical protein